MGVLEKQKIVSIEKMDTDRFIETIIYKKIADYLNIKTADIDYNKHDRSEYNVTFKQSIPNNAEVVGIEDLLYHFLKSYRSDDTKEITDKQFEKQVKDLRSTIKSLSGIESYIRRSYPKKISYNSSRSILRDITKVVTLDYLLGNNSNEATDFKLYSTVPNEYKLLETIPSANLFQTSASMTLTTNINSKFEFLSSIKKFDRAMGLNNTLTYFLDYMISYYDKIDPVTFYELVNDAFDEYEIMFNKSYMDKLEKNYYKQRTLIKNNMRLYK